MGFLRLRNPVVTRRSKRVRQLSHSARPGQARIPQGGNSAKILAGVLE